MFKQILLAAFFIQIFLPVFSQRDSCEKICPKGLEAAIDGYYVPLLFYSYDDELYTPKKEHPRITAALLCITLGPFGAHRLYLGTKPIVPAAYTITLGGGLGLIPVIDLFLITFSKDISRYKNNPHFFMWNE